jgi:hypothetical protein
MALSEVKAQAFHKIDKAWQCAELEVYRERIASQTGYRLSLALRSLLPLLAEDAPIAIGCTPERNPYTLPTLMVKLVVRGLGFRSQSPGTNLPLEMLAPAMDDVRPQLFWVNVSFTDSTERFTEQLSLLSELGRRHRVKIFCGGRAIDNEVMNDLSGIYFRGGHRALEKICADDQKVEDSP